MERKVFEGWKKVLTGNEEAYEIPMKVLEVLWRWRNHGDAGQQEEITVKFGHKWDCWNFIQLVKKDRGPQVWEGREGAKDHTQEWSPQPCGAVKTTHPSKERRAKT